MIGLGEFTNEAPASTPLHDALAAGVDVLAGPQEVTFVPYVRTVLPVDGFVFWVRADLLTDRARAQAGVSDLTPVQVQGSLHYASTGSQVEDETLVVRRVDFTAETQITAFAEIAPNVLYVGTWETSMGSFQFTFSQRLSFFQDAKLYHYVGDAVYPVFMQQLVDDLEGFSDRQVVSNSIPLWLSALQSVPFVSLVETGLDLYPAYLTPTNLRPPYATISIPPNSQRALQSVAWRDYRSTRWQLVAERVFLTFYGLRNEAISDFLDYVVDYSMNMNTFGIMSMPMIHDDRRPQVELAVLANKKMIDVEISYNQYRARDIARQLIEKTVVAWYPRGPEIALPPLPIIRIQP